MFFAKAFAKRFRIRSGSSMARSYLYQSKYGNGIFCALITYVILHTVKEIIERYSNKKINILLSNHIIIVISIIIATIEILAHNFHLLTLLGVVYYIISYLDWLLIKKYNKIASLIVALYISIRSKYYFNYIKIKFVLNKII